MGLSSRHIGALALLSASLLVGCGRNEADQVARTQAKVAKMESASAQIELKNLVQAYPKSGLPRLLLGTRLLADGNPSGAVIELQRALEFKHPPAQVLPLLIQAMVDSGQAAEAVAQYGKARVPEPGAQAAVLSALARALATNGDLAAADAAVAEALAADPRSEPAQLMKAQLQAARNDMAAAMATLDKVLAEQPRSHEAWTLKGAFLQRQPDQRKAAIEAYDKSLSIKAEQPGTLNAAISLRIAEGDLAGARQRMPQLEKLAPKTLGTGMLQAHLAYASGNNQDARELLQQLLRALPDNVSLLLSAGENELKMNSALAAEAHLAKALALAPQNALARRLLAQAQVQQGQPAKAMATLGPLLEGKDASAVVLALGAQARLLEGDTRAAEALFTRLAKLDPTDLKVRTVLASAKLDKGRDDAAFGELRSIAQEDTGTTADMALVGAHLRRGQADQALKALAGLEAKLPKDPMPQQLRGQILVMKGDAAGARKSFEAALQRSAHYFPAVAALASLDLRDGQPAQARQRLDAVLKAQPKNVPALLALAQLRQRERAPEAEVRKLIDQAVVAAPSDVAARTAQIAHHFDQGNFDAALNAALAATAALPDNVDLLELQGRCYLRVGQTRQALNSYSKIVSLYPRSARGYIGQADVFLRSNDLAQAQKAIDHALELSPGLVDAMAQAILVALQGKQYDKALAISREIQQASPGQATGWMLEGEVEMRRANWAAAAGALRKALTKAGPGASAIKLHAALQLGGKQADAQAFAAQWLKAHPADADFQFALADSAQSRGDLAGAEAGYRKLLTLQPDHALGLNNLAMLLLQQKKPGALPLAERAVANAPSRPELLDTLAQAQAADDQLAKAVITQQRALALAPEAAELRLALARLLIQSGNKPQAREELLRLAKLGQAFSQQDEVLRLTRSLNSGLPGR